jgi:hypothetical protein
MKNTLFAHIILAVLTIFLLPNTVEAKTKEKDIQSIINKSVASYKGNCPCPWSTMKNGRKCGKNSAWSKPGGAKPICYSSDIK